MRQWIAASLLPLALGCGTSPGEPEPSPGPAVAQVDITGLTPVSGSTVVVPGEYPYILPGGVVLPPGSGLVSVDVSLSSPPVPRAQLNVYLLTAGTSTEYCGQNDPDSPTWTSLPEGWTTRFRVTGFRVHRLPCDVTGIRAMLHTRNDGRLTPPTPDLTLAEEIAPADFRIRREE